jgi:hypothetical protein
MAAIRPQTSPLGKILLAAKKLLNDELFAGEGYVVIGRDTKLDPIYFPEKSIRIYPSGLSLDPRVGGGAGIYYMNLARSLIVEYMIRVSLDSAGEGEIELTSPDLGLLYFEEAILNVLQQKNLFDDDGVKLTNQPLLVIDNNPEIVKSDIPATDVVWGFLTFQLKYSLPTTRSV